MQACTEASCRGGINCCNYDPQVGAYCVTDTFCNAVPPLWEVIFLPIFLLLVTAGVALVIYRKYRKAKLKSFTLANFVEREVRLEPIDRYEQTKTKTVTSFD